MFLVICIQGPICRTKMGKERGKGGEKNELKTTSSQGGHGSISDVRRQGVGGYLKKRKNGATSFMDGP